MNTKTKSGLGWSLHLGRWLGIDVYLHFTFLLLLAFIGLSQGLIGRSLDAAVGGVLFFTGLFVCVLLHEYGHALAARRYGIGRTQEAAAAQRSLPPHMPPVIGAPRVITGLQPSRGNATCVQ